MLRLESLAKLAALNCALFELDDCTRVLEPAAGGADPPPARQPQPATVPAPDDGR